MARAPTAQRLLRTWLRFSAANQFDDATWRPELAQEKKLLEIVRRNSDTAYGREHGFADIASVADFRAHVPQNTYESLTPYLERTFEGEDGVLTADRPVMFATTSGTTGRAKYIPVTPSYLHEYSHGVHVHLYRIFSDYDDVLEGKMLVSSSSDEEGRSGGDVPYGAISGFMTRNQPGAIKRFYVLPYEISKIKAVESKYYLTLLHGLGSDVRLLITPNPSSLLLLAEKMTVWAEELIHDVRTGSVNPDFLPENAPASLTASLRADPDRADELARILRTTGRLRPLDVWPNLRLMSCWKGGTMPLYLRKLPDYFGDLPIRDFGYMASEGRGATPLVDSGAGGVLNITSHFFEFVAEEERDDPGKTFLTADQLESNREYYIYFTTSSGLYRYDINDVVRVVDFYRRTPVIQFVRKGQGMTSITGEKLTESQVTGALCEVVDANGFDVQHFTACVEWGEPPHYALYAELGAGMDGAAARRFATAFDRSLCVQNLEYEAKRESTRLGPPVLKRVAPGTYQALRQRRVAEGAPEAQVKIPQLSTNMEFGAGFEVLEEVSADA
jgi:GH3 auxin-responsive promoter